MDRQQEAQTGVIGERAMSACTHALPSHYQGCHYCSIITRNTISDESTTHVLSGLHFERDVHLTELYIDGTQFCSLDGFVSSEAMMSSCF
jgi:hypothetical protein